MQNAKLLGQIRHVLTAVGGYAVGRGYIDEQTATMLAGVGATVIGALWSWFAPEKK